MSSTLARRLPAIAADITREHKLAEAGYRTAIDHALKVGALLKEAKTQVEHGEWLPWLAEHTPISARNAQQYMQLAGSPNTKAISHLGIEGALREIQQPAAKPASPDLRTALGGVDEADAKAALDELGPMRREANPFPAPGMQQTTWRQISEALARIRRAMDEGSASGLSNWSRKEALHEGARHARSVASQLAELADSLSA